MCYTKSKLSLDCKSGYKGNDLTDNKLTCCFTGHRPQKLPWGFDEDDERCEKMKAQTERLIEMAINSGYENFLTGMALGFDIIVAEILLKLKKAYPHIKIVGALPCKNQDCVWRKEQRKRYKKILRKLDNIRCIYENYEEGCNHERNKYMIDNSSLCIALYDGKGGGTKQTIDYAKCQGLKVVIVKP